MRGPLRGSLAAAVLACLAAAVAAPACGQPAGLPAGGEERCVEAPAAATPPCGYITPMMDIDLPEKLPCGLGIIRFTEADREHCAPLPPPGGSVTLQGTLFWGWRISDDGTYPNDPATDIVINFPRAAGTPAWMEVRVDPPEFRISTATLNDPNYVRADTQDPLAPVFWYHYEKPITVTIQRVGDPTPEELRQLHNQRQPPPDIQPVFVKARSNPSGTYFTSAFAVDIVQFDARSPQAQLPPADGQEAPMPALGWVVAAVAAAMLLRRR